MNNPNSPIDLEETAIQYMMTSLKGLGFFQAGNSEMYGREYMRGIARGLVCFLLDHVYTNTYQTGSTTNFVGDDTPLIKVDINPDAWMN